MLSAYLVAFSCNKNKLWLIQNTNEEANLKLYVPKVSQDDPTRGSGTAMRTGTIILTCYAFTSESSSRCWDRILEFMSTCLELRCKFSYSALKHRDISLGQQWAWRFSSKVSREKVAVPYPSYLHHDKACQLPHCFGRISKQNCRSASKRSCAARTPKSHNR